HPHPIITAVNGIAAGAGCSFALLGDMIIATEDAYFLQAFRRIGLVPDAGSTYILARTLGRARAMEMTLMGDKIPAEQAKAWGLINEVVPSDELMPRAMEIAHKLADGPTLALGQIRKLIWDAQQADLSTTLHNERIAQRIAGQTSDFKEGVSAFLEKRPTEFTGN
ncbi:MAG: enoyl-CoA hydratase-related protein, partial [Pseudomonadota bacterium]